MNEHTSLNGELAGARVIVTGASGFIGFNLIRVLASLGPKSRLSIESSLPSACPMFNSSGQTSDT